MPFLAAIVQRVLYSLILLLAVLVLNFTLVHLAPGDPAEVIAGEMGGATAEMLASIRATYGLDQPLHTQLWRYVSRVAQGDLGYSYFFDTPVTSLIVSRVFPTILLVVCSLSLDMLVGTLLGVIAACRPRGFLSHCVTVMALISYSAPVFWTGIMLLILFASALPFFPVSGMYDVVLGAQGMAYVWDVVHHMVLPVITLASIYLAIYSRLARASMLEVLSADYIRTARAKGVREQLVIYKHALRNALLPVVTIAGLQFGQLFSGAVLVETVFSWPGLGTLRKSRGSVLDFVPDDDWRHLSASTLWNLTAKAHHYQTRVPAKSEATSNALSIRVSRTARAESLHEELNVCEGLTGRCTEGAKVAVEGNA